MYALVHPRRLALLVALIPLLGASALAQESARLRVRVLDSAGVPVAGARVRIEDGWRQIDTSTGADGVLEVEVGRRGLSVEVEAPGFREETVDGDATAGDVTLDVVLEPVLPSEEIVVTPGRATQRVGETPASIAILGERDLEATAAPTLDDALRQVAGFSLFRRTSSRTANPTTQGVSLRGIGASGTSRALVLLDGVPLNDPFGGWVAWGRVPRETVARVEVMRGGGSDLYGSSALGGVVNVLGDLPSRTRLSLEASGGLQETGLVSTSATIGWNGWAVRLASEGFRTDGHVPVAEEARGPVDASAGSKRALVDARVDRFGDGWRVFVSGSLFGERRANGTKLQVNSTTTRLVTAGSEIDLRERGLVSLRAFALSQDYAQTFSAISADRSQEFLTRTQLVPSQSAGGSAQWAAVVDRHTLVAGADGRETRGASDEIAMSGGAPFSAIGAGGRERTIGAFGQDAMRLGDRWIVTLGARVDRWRELDGLSVTRPLALAGPLVARELEDRAETALSPRASVLFKATPRFSLSASAYRAFRAPTLNELYRAFRVGNVLTLANPGLRAERLTGGELNTRLTALDDRLEVRAGGFWSDVARPVANVTLSATPELITRRRENLGRLRARGLELEAEARPAARVTLSGGYLFTRSTVEEFPANRGLEGLRVPQVPAHQVTAQARVTPSSRVTFGLQFRAASRQFDDDLNELPLAAFATLDALGSYRLTEGVALFAAAENLFGARIVAGRTPVETLGPPATVRIGLRLSLRN